MNDHWTQTYVLRINLWAQNYNKHLTMVPHFPQFVHAKESLCNMLKAHCILLQLHSKLMELMRKELLQVDWQ